MKITDICESTTSGSVATVAAPMNGGPLKRSAVGKGVYGKEPAESLFTGKKTNKKYANSVSESKKVREGKFYGGKKDRRSAGEMTSHLSKGIYPADASKPIAELDRHPLLPELIRVVSDIEDNDSGYLNPRLDSLQWELAEKISNDTKYSATGIIYYCGSYFVTLRDPNRGWKIPTSEALGGFPGESVTVIYIDDKPVVQYAKPEEADKALKLLRKKYPEAKIKYKQVVKEAGMPSPVIKHKQKLAGMSDAELAERLKDKSDDELKKMAERHGYGKMSPHYVSRVNKGKKINENELQETDLIIGPGQGHRLKSGFISRAEDRRDHEVEMARSDLHQAHKNSSKIHRLIKNVSEDDGLEGWVQAKITKAADYLNSVCQYLEGKHLHEMTGGVIAGGGVGESLSEGKHDSYNLRDLGNDLKNYVGSDSESVLVTKILNILRNNYTDSRGKNLPNREIAGSELMSLYGISKRDQGAFINFIDKVYGGPKKDEEDSYNSFRFEEEADLLDEGMGLKQLAAAAAAIGYMLVPNNVGDGTSGRSSADRAYDTYLSQTPSHLIPRYTAPTKAK